MTARHIDALHESWVAALLDRSRSFTQAARKRVKLLHIAVSIAAIATLGYFVDLHHLIVLLREIDGQAIALATILVVSGIALGAVRGWLIMRDFGFGIGFLPAAQATTWGSIGGIFGQFAGHAIVQSAYLRRHGISFSDTLLLTLYERVVAALAVIAIGVVGAAYLYLPIRAEAASGGLELLKLAAGVLSALLVGAFFGYGELAAIVLRRIATIAAAFRVVRLFAMTLAVQLLNIGVFLAIGLDTVADVAPDKFIAATAVVVLAAALPISVSGWGVRELGAVVAYGAIGVGAEQALTISVVAGALSTIVLVALTAAMSAARAAAAVPASAPAIASRMLPVDSFALICWLLPLAAVTLVFFQVPLGAGGDKINLNFADPVVALGALAAIAFWVRQRAKAPLRWRVAAIEPALAATSAVVALAWLNGWFSIGWISWAFYNRFLGWFALLAYFLTGALVVNHAGDQGIRIFVRTLVAVAAGVVLSEWGMLAAGWARVIAAPTIPMVGPAQNSNAFAFQLVIALAAALSLSPSVKTNGNLVVLRLLSGLILSGIWMTSSRTIYLGSGLVLMAMTVFRIASVRHVLWIVAISFMVVELKPVLTAVSLYLDALRAGSAVPFGTSDLVSMNFRSGLRSIVQPDRVRSLIGGWELWLERPFLGSGLGAFVHREAVQTGGLLVIHSNPLWLLAEAGMIGLVVFAASFIAVARQVWARWRDGRALADTVALSAMALMGLAAQLHDMLYQRIFWLVAGAALARSLRDPGRANGHGQ